MAGNSPAGSTAFFVLALLSICAAVLLLLRYYLPLRTTPAFITVPVFLTIALPASIVLLVPIDLASSAGTKGIWLSDTVVYKSWRVTYWLTGRLKRIQASAPKIHEKLEESLEKLEEYEAQVVQLKQRKNGTTREFQEWIDELAEKSSLPESRAPALGRSSAATVPPIVTERYLADLTRKLKRARHAKVRFESEWDHVVQKAVRTQAILDSKASQRLEFKNSPFQTRGTRLLDRIPLLTPYTRYLLHVHIIPTLFYTAWALTSLASLAVVWSECIRSLVRDPKLSVIGLTVVHHPPSSRGQIGFGGQLIAATWLCYMLTCSFFSLSEVKIWGNRALVRRNTYQESATWYALQVAKLTVPLSYNFVTFMPRKIVHEMSFFKLLGRYVDLTPVGEKFSDYFPSFVLVPVLATAFGLYGKIKRISGFGDLLEDEAEDADAAEGISSWREGRSLIEREVQSSSGAGNGSLGLGLAQRSRGERTFYFEAYSHFPSEDKNRGGEQCW
ncbi:hypothetical protein GRF29_216g1049710 [Pseudopithomyces chartarum]|uniref:Uncharacterized protein n=1 Tax=Pseudopithomyces chartarum TaxID=1892770 RepID=A0AAN6RB51_9PLEO|nr:hypothetical protein GRF29_216g1049710 [Pseudopithomyces chartarum]